jgi:hypothetical protein
MWNLTAIIALSVSAKRIICMFPDFDDKDCGKIGETLTPAVSSNYTASSTAKKRWMPNHQNLYYNGLVSNSIHF